MKKMLFGLLVLIFGFKVFAISNINIVEGVDYTIIPMSSQVKKIAKVNVKEFFAFTCIHCKLIEPLVENFIKANKNIDFEKIHVVWNDDKTTEYLAKISASMQVMNLKNLYIPFFDAIFNKVDIANPVQLKLWLQNNKVSEQQSTQFISTMDSFTVTNMVNYYKALTVDPKYNITGTPTFIVADKYIIAPAKPQRTIEVLQALIKMQKSKG